MKPVGSLLRSRRTSAIGSSGSPCESASHLREGRPERPRRARPRRRARERAREATRAGRSPEPVVLGVRILALAERGAAVAARGLERVRVEDVAEQRVAVGEAR